MKSITLILTACMIHFTVLAQNNEKKKLVDLHGVVSYMHMPDSSETELADIAIEIWSEGQMIAVTKSDQKGRYRYKLPFYHNYHIKYGQKPYLTKIVEIDATDFSYEAQERGYEIEVDIALIIGRDNPALDFLKNTPIARAAYSKKDNRLEWDVEYVERMNNKLGLIISSMNWQ
jgi:hypothetical protein